MKEINSSCLEMYTNIWDAEKVSVSVFLKISYGKVVFLEKINQYFRIL